MNDGIVKIKGTKTGLQLTFCEGAEFSEIEKDIREKLESGSGFFTRGTVIQVAPGELRTDEGEKLKKLFSGHGILFRIGTPVPSPVVKPVQDVAEKTEEQKSGGGPEEEDLQQMKVVNRTLRGGQEIKTKGSVLVCGNVNPGAQIIAGGSIDIRGTCRGMVHAGADGNTKAFIIADHLMPTQIRIANLIARSPDEMEKTDKAERASIKDGQIVIEPIER